MEPFIGQICIFGFNFAPRGWAFCNGQLMSIAQNAALFSLLGTTYGGDGVSTFAMPNLQGRAPVGMGTGAGLTTITQGEMSGVQQVTMSANQMPQHTHTATINPLADSLGTGTDDPNNAYLVGGSLAMYSTSQDTKMATLNAVVSIAGGSQPLPILNPYLGVNYCIATEGIFPSRP